MRFPRAISFADRAPRLYEIGLPRLGCVERDPILSKTGCYTFSNVMKEHIPFLIELAGKLGPPVLSATLVICLVTRKLELLHIVLILVGLLLIIVEHRYTNHRRG